MTLKSRLDRLQQAAREGLGIADRLRAARQAAAEGRLTLTPIEDLEKSSSPLMQRLARARRRYIAMEGNQ